MASVLDLRPIIHGLLFLKYFTYCFLKTVSPNEHTNVGIGPSTYFHSFEKQF